MELMLKAAACAAIAAVLGLAVKKGSPELSALLALGAALLCVYLVSGALGEVTGFIRELAAMPGMNAPAINIVLKTVGISIVTRLSSNVCKDAGQSALSSGVETAGAAAALWTALPLFRSVVRAVGSIL